MVDFSLKGKIALVTGASYGIGFAIASAYAEAGATIVFNDIKPEMIEEATANAREAAQKFAKDCDSRLGKIKTASQGQFTITDRDSNTPYIKNVRVVTSVVYYLND